MQKFNRSRLTDAEQSKQALYGPPDFVVYNTKNL